MLILLILGWSLALILYVCVLRLSARNRALRASVKTMVGSAQVQARLLCVFLDTLQEDKRQIRRLVLREEVLLRLLGGETVLPSVLVELGLSQPAPQATRKTLR